MTRVAKAREWVMDLIKHGLVTNRLNAKTTFLKQNSQFIDVEIE